jgi:hypothetical protein
MGADIAGGEPAQLFQAACFFLVVVVVVVVVSVVGDGDGDVLL